MKNALFFISSIILFLGCKSDTSIESAKNYKLPSEMSGISTLLDSILQEDQQYRFAADSLNRTVGWNSEEFQKVWAKVSKADRGNLIIVEKILKKYGWLGPEDVGESANSALFYVIQHSYQKTQEKYLPMIKQAVIESKAEAKNLALLEDRVLVGQGKKQIYGSQFTTDPDTKETYILPLIDPDKVDERRMSIGLDSMYKNAKRFGIIWDVETYKARMNK